MENQSVLQGSEWYCISENQVTNTQTSKEFSDKYTNETRKEYSPYCVSAQTHHISVYLRKHTYTLLPAKSRSRPSTYAIPYDGNDDVFGTDISQNYHTLQRKNL